MPGGYSETSLISYATAGTSSKSATRNLESTVGVNPAAETPLVELDTTAADNSMDEYYAEYDSLTAFYGMDYATEYGSYSSYYTA
mgnify:FL=1